MQKKQSAISLISTIYDSLDASTISLEMLISREEEPVELPSEISDEVSRLAAFLGCTPGQAIIFSVIYNSSVDEGTIEWKSLTKKLNQNPVEFSGYIDILEDMALRKLIHRYCEYGMRSFGSMYVSRFALNAVIKNNPDLLRKTQIADTGELLHYFYLLVDAREKESISSERLMEEVQHLKSENEHLQVIRSLSAQHLEAEDELILLLLCYYWMEGDDEIELKWFLQKLFEDYNTRTRLRKDIIQGNASLCRKDLVRMDADDFRGQRLISLSDKAFKLLLEYDGALDLLLDKKPKFKFSTHIGPEVTSPQNLFFNHAEQEHLDTLKSLFSETKLGQVTGRMKEINMRTGFCVLLHGEPGTGKTEFAKQLARSTKRDLLIVNISQIRGMWVGESEKNLKAIFEEYKRACSYFKQKPILLFNESDALIGKRIEVSRTVDQMHNSMQNILLQEMEDFEGIMLATTNMADTNMDPAFERRFLYKVPFCLPLPEAASRIWCDKLPLLSESEAWKLAKEYPLSGGQIENVARKFQIGYAITGNIFSLDKLMELCAEEHFFKRNLSNPIGF